MNFLLTRPPTGRLLAIAAACLVAASCSTANSATTTTSSMQPPGETSTTVIATTTTSSTTTTSTTTTTVAPEVEVAIEACAGFAAAPYPARLGILNDAATTAGVLTSQMQFLMKDLCPEEIAAFLEIDAITDQSRQLDWETRVNDVGLYASCADETSVTVQNPFDFPIGLFAVVYRGTFEDIRTSSVVLVPSLEPGKELKIAAEFSSTPGDCGGVVSPFLVTPDTDISDVWTPPATATQLPDTTGSDWLTLMQDLLDTEIGIQNSGRQTEFGAIEDIRSANYDDLTSPPFSDSVWTDQDVLEICSAMEFDGDLTAVVYIGTDRGEDAPETKVGLFRRSPQDGRWRWLHTAIQVAPTSNCDIVADVSLLMSGTSV